MAGNVAPLRKQAATLSTEFGQKTVNVYIFGL